MERKKITLPLTRELARTLHAGDQVLLTGTIYTSRDAGHKRMCEALAKGEKIPFDPTDATIYYVGPTPAKPGAVIGSAGPTTSGRMDAYAPTMMSVGARGMIGKGARLPEVVDAMKKYDGVYFGAIGGAGALLAKCIKKAELIAYEDLGAEALRKLYVEDRPLVVIIDSEKKISAEQTDTEQKSDKTEQLPDVKTEKADKTEQIYQQEADERKAQKRVREAVQKENSEAAGKAHESYVIQPGDTLFQISMDRYGSIEAISQICKLNGMSADEIIYPGQVIVLP